MPEPIPNDGEDDSELCVELSIDTIDAERVGNGSEDDETLVAGEVWGMLSEAVDIEGDDVAIVDGESDGHGLLGLGVAWTMEECEPVAPWLAGVVAGLVLALLDECPGDVLDGYTREGVHDGVLLGLVQGT